ncbi:DUF6287 domain-containing protein [Oenococcus oeni]
MAKYKSGHVYANRKIKIGNETINTDHNGQFVAHILPNKRYSVNNKGTKFTISANKNGNTKTTGMVSSGMHLSTYNKNEQINVRSGVAYLDNTSHYHLNIDKKTFSFKTPLLLRKNDKIFVAPSIKNSGYAFKIKNITRSGDHYVVGVLPIKPQDVLSSLKIHTGKIDGNKLSSLQNNKKNQLLIPLSFDPKIEELKEFGINNKYGIKLSKKDFSAEGSLKNEIEGSFSIDANFYFSSLDYSKSSFKVKDSLRLSNELAVKLAALNLSHNKEITLASIPIMPAVDIPIKLYAEGSLSVVPSLNFVTEPEIYIQGSGKKGITANYKNTNTQLSLMASGKLSGAAGIESGPSISLFDDEYHLFDSDINPTIMETDVTGAINGEGNLQGKISDSGENSFSGSGNLSFESQLEIDSPILNDVSGNKTEFTYEHTLLELPLLGKEKNQETQIINAAEKSVKKTESDKSLVDSHVAKEKNEANDKYSQQNMNLNQIETGNTSSIEGTWEDGDGDKLMITGKYIPDFLPEEDGHAPEGSFALWGKGFEYAKEGTSAQSFNSSDNLPLLIDTLNYSGAGDGGIWFVKAGQKLPSQAIQENIDNSGNTISDNSNSSLDRIFFGSGAGAWADDINGDVSKGAYYKVKDTNSSSKVTISKSDLSQMNQDIKSSQSAINKITFYWPTSIKNLLQGRLDKVKTQMSSNDY